MRVNDLKQRAANPELLVRWHHQHLRDGDGGPRNLKILLEGSRKGDQLFLEVDQKVVPNIVQMDKARPLDIVLQQGLQMCIEANEVRVGRVNLVHFELLGNLASFTGQFELGSSDRLNPFGGVGGLKERIWCLLLNFPAKLSYVLTWVLEASPLPLEVLYEGLPGGDQRVATEMRRQAPLNVILFVIVMSQARALGLFA